LARKNIIPVTDARIEEEFSKFIEEFLSTYLDKHSLARKISVVRKIDRGSGMIIQMQNGQEIYFGLKEVTSGSFLKDEFIQNSDFDIIRQFLIRLADNIANEETTMVLEELGKSAGHKIDAKGDILGGLIEAAERMKSSGHSPDTLILHPNGCRKLEDAIRKDPKRAEILKRLLGGTV